MDILKFEVIINNVLYSYYSTAIISTIAARASALSLKCVIDLVWGAGGTKNCGYPLKQVVTLITTHKNISSMIMV